MVEGVSEKIIHHIGLLLNNTVQQTSLSQIINELGYSINLPSKISHIWEDLAKNNIIILDEENAARSLSHLLQLKKQYSKDHLPILILINQLSNVSHWIDLGCDDIILTPMNKTDIAARLQVWITQGEKLKTEQNITMIKPEEEISFSIQPDTLTGVANFTSFQQEFKRIVASAKRRKKHFALLHVDIMHFTDLNTSLGHTLSDFLLQELAKRLTACLRKSDMVARYKAAEFMIVLIDIIKGEDAAVIADKIFQVTSYPFILNGKEVLISLNIGISVFPENGEEDFLLLKNANIALHFAKDMGRNKFQFCSADFAKKIAVRSSIESSLKQAMQLDEFKLMYQPKVEIATGKVLGVEALIRWKSPSGEMTYPTEFIPMAEEMGEIIPITEWVLKTACRHIKMTQSYAFPRLNVSVNLSGKVFKEKYFPNSLDNVLMKTGLHPKYLELEISEKYLLEDIGNIIIFLKQLKSIGIQISIDKFGVSQSSLSYLKLFSIDRIKIDRSIINNIKNNSNDAAVATAIISMAHSLNIKVVAEGVEHKDQLKFLEQAGCDEYQGYYFSKPLASDELVPFLSKIKKDNSFT